MSDRARAASAKEMAPRATRPVSVSPRPADPADESIQGAVLQYQDFRVRPHNCFACGELNDAGLQLKVHMSADRSWTELTLTSRYEGWEGIVHGGILCTILDDIMGWALRARDSWSVTARLSVQYRKPVAVGRTIRAEGWVTEARGRIHIAAARILDVETGEELATAEATFVAATEARKRELKARYAAQETAE